MAAINCLLFLPILKKVGFYLDDWATMAYLHFAPRTNLGEFLWSYLHNDSRVQGRPLEVLHFGLVNWFFGESPWAYHLLNLFFECIAAGLAYLVFVRLSGSRTASFIAALFVMLHPGHDSTHYWVLCSSVPLSLCLYTGSLLLTVEAVVLPPGDNKKRFVFLAASSGLFFLSLLNYEVFLVLASLNVLLAFLYLSQSPDQNAECLPLLSRVRAASGYALWYLVPFLLLLAYLKLVLPMIGTGYSHGVSFDLPVFWRTMAAGINLNMPWTLTIFAAEQVRSIWFELGKGELLGLGIMSGVAGVACYWCWRLDAAESVRHGLLTNKSLLVLGVVGLIASYLLFGLNPDYEPTYYTMVNRVNAGAAFCCGFILLAVLCLIKVRLRSLAWKTLSAALCLSLTIFLAIADEGLAKPWQVSWLTQKTVYDHLREQHRKGLLPADQSYLLVNCPRYVLWSPVFDGVWDFGNMMRIISDDTNLKANVVSERLSIDGLNVTDRSRGYDCGDYTLGHLALVVAPQAELVEVSTPKAFIETVRLHGMKFGLDSSILKNWQEQAAKTAARR